MLSEQARDEMPLHTPGHTPHQDTSHSSLFVNHVQNDKQQPTKRYQIKLKTVMANSSYAENGIDTMLRVSELSRADCAGLKVHDKHLSYVALLLERITRQLDDLKPVQQWC